jgi:bifunctional non-homologous end joining protein LigD
MLEKLYGKLSKLRTSSSPFAVRVKDEAVTTWVKPRLVDIAPRSAVSEG